MAVSASDLFADLDAHREQQRTSASLAAATPAPVSHPQGEAECELARERVARHYVEELLQVGAAAPLS